MNKKLYLWVNRLRLDFQLTRKGHFFEIIVHEKYRIYIKITKYFLTLIGLISAFFYFKSVFIAFLFGLGIYLLSSLLEKIILSYVNLYIQPLPDFEIEKDKWVAMSFGYAEEPKSKGHIPIVGMVFSHEEYGRKIYSLLVSWNYGQLKDVDNNICTSIILDDMDDYVFFCYPSTNRETVTEFFKRCKKERKEKSLTDVQMRHICSLILGKRFKMTALLYLPTFLKRYRDGSPYLFQIQKKTPQGDPSEIASEIEGTRSILKFNLKVRKKDELTRKDIEYDVLGIPPDG